MSEQLTEEQRAATPCLVALCPKCSSIIACAVQLPDLAKENADEVYDWVKHGLTVSTIPVAEVRTGKWCDCKRDKKPKRD